jgi:ABC-type branched-subunit amino acid transport system ATPase component
VLRGSLAPEGSVVKLAVDDTRPRRFSGPARIYHSRDAGLEGLRNGEIQPGEVVLLSGIGLRGGPGMGLTSAFIFALDGAGLGDKCAVITDGQMSGLVNKGIVVGEVSPEAARGGPLALVRDGDPIRIDVPGRAADLDVPAAELERRRQSLRTPAPGGCGAQPTTGPMTGPITGGTPALAVTGMSVAYGDMVAVHDATFSIAQGEACAITGPNGNGKSSLLMGITGLVRRRGGVQIFGASAPNGDVRWAARHGLTLVPERRQLYPGLSAADNIVLGCYCWTSSLRKARASRPFGLALELFPEIGPHLRQPAGTLSSGQQQMVAIMRGLASDPKVLAVDEPCLGLAEAMSRRVYDALARIHQAGTTLIVVEEAPKRALTICDRRVEVRNGVVTGSGAS